MTPFNMYLIYLLLGTFLLFIPGNFDEIIMSLRERWHKTVVYRTFHTLTTAISIIYDHQVQPYM